MIFLLLLLLVFGIFRVSYIEIYNEKIFDLLNKREQNLKISENNGVVSINCQEFAVSSEKDLLEYLIQGNKERTVGCTNMNERSSRSHAVFRIVSEEEEEEEEAHHI